NVAAQGWQPGLAGDIGCRAGCDELTATAIAYSRLARAIPQIAASGRGDREVAFAWVRELLGAIVPIVQRPHLLDEVRRVSGHAPFVAIGADLGIHVEVVQQHELTGEPVQVGRDSLREEAERGIAIALR